MSYSSSDRLLTLSKKAIIEFLIWEGKSDRIQFTLITTNQLQ